MSDPSSGGLLDRRLCQVVGLNQNYTARSGTPYHVQVEDRGPVLDRLTEREVRRLNVIIYANYGEANARIVHGRDHDFEDLRTAAHNQLIEAKVKEVAERALVVIEEHEARLVERIKGLLRSYHHTKDESAKREFEAENALYPFLFSRAWRELREDKGRPVAAVATPAANDAVAPVVVYPLDAEAREQVIEIERVIAALGNDLKELMVRGTADDILLQTCRKLILRAQDTLRQGSPSDFNVRRLEMTKTSLLTTWRQVRSVLKREARSG